MNRRLFLVLALALLVRIVTFAGYTGIPDEMINADIVRQIVQGAWPTYEDTQHIIEMTMPTRIGYLAPTAALVKLLGFTDLSVVLYPLLGSLLTVWLTYLLGKRWVGETAGLWAALLYAVFPLDVVFATKMYLETAMNFWCTLAVFLFFLAEERESGRKSAAWALLAGLAVGIAYLHKVTAGYCCVLFALIGTVTMVRERRIRPRYVFLALGFLLVFGFEMGFHAVLHDDPLYPWHVYARQADSPELATALRGEWRQGVADDLKRLFWTFPLRTLVSFRLGAFYWFIFPAVLFCLCRRPRKYWPPLLWWFVLMLFINLSTFKGGRLPFLTRQTILFSVPGVILLAAFLEELRALAWLGSRQARRGGLAVLTVLALLSVSGALGFWFLQGPIVRLFARTYLARTFIPLEMDVAEWYVRIFWQNILAGGVALALFFLLAAATAWRREKRGEGRWPASLLAPVVAGFLAISSVALAYSENRGFPHSENDAFQAVKDLPVKPIYADWYTKQILDFHFGFPPTERVTDFGGVNLEDVHDAYLVYNVFRSGMAERLHKFAADNTMVSQFDRYVQSYKPVDAARNDSWKCVETINNGLILILHIP